MKNIVFDFGGVLVHYDFKRFFRTYFSSDEETERFMHNVFNHANTELDRGVESPSHIISRTKRTWPEYKVPLDALLERYEDIFTGEIEGMAELMDSLKEQGFTLLGLSNWSALVERIMRKYPTLFGKLDGMLISKDVHLLKPDRDIYQAFCDKFGVKAEECIFIDDKEENIRGAQQYGMQGIVFRNAQQLRQALMPLLEASTTTPTSAPR